MTSPKRTTAARWLLLALILGATLSATGRAVYLGIRSFKRPPTGPAMAARARELASLEPHLRGARHVAFVARDRWDTRLFMTQYCLAPVVLFKDATGKRLLLVEVLPGTKPSSYERAWRPIARSASGRFRLFQRRKGR